MLKYSYKLRFYKTSGPDKGNLKNEEFFEDREKMVSRYNEVFKEELYGLNPTAWQYAEDDWKRVSL